MLPFGSHIASCLYLLHRRLALVCVVLFHPQVVKQQKLFSYIFFFFFNQFVGAELSLEAHAALAVRHTWACLVVRTLEHEYMPLL